MPLPVALADDGDRPSERNRSLRRFQRIQDSADLDVFRHEVQAAALSAIDQIDAQTMADALRVSLEEELRLLEDGMNRAGTSKAALELVAKKITILSSLNDRRVARRWR